MTNRHRTIGVRLPLTIRRWGRAMSKEARELAIEVIDGLAEPAAAAPPDGTPAVCAMLRDAVERIATTLEKQTCIYEHMYCSHAHNYPDDDGG